MWHYRTVAGVLVAEGLAVGFAVLSTGVAAADSVGAAGAAAEAEYVRLIQQTGWQPPPSNDPMRMTVLEGYLVCEVARAGAVPNPLLFPAAQATLCPDVVDPVIPAAPPPPPAVPPRPLTPQEEAIMNNPEWNSTWVN